MRHSSQSRTSQQNSKAVRGRNVKEKGRSSSSGGSPTEPTERDPLIATSGGSARTQTSYTGTSTTPTSSYTQGIRARRSSRSPLQQSHHQQQLRSSNQTGDPPMGERGVVRTASHGGRQNKQQFSPALGEGDYTGAINNYASTDYEIHTPHPENASHDQIRQPQPQNINYGDYRKQQANKRSNQASGERAAPSPLIDVPEEIYAVRKAALTVLDPLTYTWLVVAIGFSLSVALGMARWTLLLPDITYWFILLPSWLSHVGLLICHILSARALSTFISEANENRQRHDSTDHLDRTEYLPLLQRSLKFGLKTGILSFCVFLSELLMYFRVSKESVSFGVALLPIWILVVGAIIDGIICKTQHFLRVFCWVLVFAVMLMTVLRVDHGIEAIRWRFIVVPIVALLSISSASLIYIVYGHQIGYFRLTESQLRAGILYSMSALICIVLVVIVGEFIPLARPVEVETRVFVVILAPLVVALVGVGAWAVSRDEFERLLQYGGQAAVHPMKLRLEPAGWTSVESRGVTTIPMFGEVSYEPLDSTKSQSIELCTCCACYPYEDDDEATAQYHETREINNHPYLSPGTSQTSARWGTGTGIHPQGLV